MALRCQGNQFLQSVSSAGLSAKKGAWLYGDYLNELPGVHDPVTCAQILGLQHDLADMAKTIDNPRIDDGGEEEAKDGGNGWQSMVLMKATPLMNDEIRGDLWTKVMAVVPIVVRYWNGGTNDDIADWITGDMGRTPPVTDL
ncbi:unnamed protein product [Symbiodinium sp. CCMP2592]|nr:unnamed protein product [Symbiodinium sp. CCMP2592]